MKHSHILTIIFCCTGLCAAGCHAAKNAESHPGEVTETDAAAENTASPDREAADGHAHGADAKSGHGHAGKTAPDPAVKKRTKRVQYPTTGVLCDREACQCGGNADFPNYCGKGFYCDEGKCRCGLITADMSTHGYECIDHRWLCRDVMLSSCRCGDTFCGNGSTCTDGRCVCGDAAVTEDTTEFNCVGGKWICAPKAGGDSCRFGNGIVPAGAECDFAAHTMTCAGMPPTDSVRLEPSKWQCAGNRWTCRAGSCCGSDGCKCGNNTCGWKMTCENGRCMCGDTVFDLDAAAYKCENGRIICDRADGCKCGKIQCKEGCECTGGRCSCG